MNTKARNRLALAWNLTAALICICCPILVLVLDPVQYRQSD